MEFLGLRETVFEGARKQRKIFATGFNLSKYRKEKVIEMLEHFSTAEGRQIRNDLIHLDDANCSDLIFEYGEELVIPLRRPILGFHSGQPSP